MYVENEYCAKHQCVLVNEPEWVPSSNLISSATASGSSQSSFHPCDLSCDDKEYLMPKYVAERTHQWSDCAACILTATRPYFNSPPEEAKNCGQIDQNPNDYDSDQTESSCTFWISDITDWWRQQGEMHSKYAYLSNVARDIFSIIPHGVVVEASLCQGQDVTGWRQSKTTCETLHQQVIVRQFAGANDHR